MLSSTVKEKYEATQLRGHLPSSSAPRASLASLGQVSLGGRPPGTEVSRIEGERPKR